MANRLPTVGGDPGNWGTILNDFLSTEHNPLDGTHPDASTSTKGFVKLATQNEVNSGVSSSTVPTPAAIQSKLFSTQTLTDQATIVWDLSLGAFAEVTLTDNRTLANPSNLVNGASYILIVKQDSVGGRTLNFGNKYKFPGAIAPTLSVAASSTDIITFICDGTNLYGTFLGSFG